MPKIKLNFRQLTIMDKVAKARQIVTSLMGNAAFTTPSPTLAAIIAAIDELETAHADVQAARQAAKTKTSAQSVKEDALDKLMSQLAAYVESVSGENETLIKSAGMDTRAAATGSTDTPRQPSALEAASGDHLGEADLSWDSVPSARSYVVEKSPDPPSATSWAHASVSTKARATMNGLTPGSRYWFRVAAIGTNGQSGWSDPATCIAP
ncbi:MAG TPA: fibronectin type III domain-containing protein [Pyrinomonadaceae bacterium]|jgi:hypothetical protein